MVETVSSVVGRYLLRMQEFNSARNIEREYRHIFNHVSGGILRQPVF